MQKIIAAMKQLKNDQVYCLIKKGTGSEILYLENIMTFQDFLCEISKDTDFLIIETELNRYIDKERFEHKLYVFNKNNLNIKNEKDAFELLKIQLRNQYMHINNGITLQISNSNTIHSNFKFHEDLCKSLLSFSNKIDYTQTNAGRKLLRNALLTPFNNQNDIQDRNLMVNYLLKNHKIVQNLRNSLAKLPNIDVILKRLKLITFEANAQIKNKINLGEASISNRIYTINQFASIQKEISTTDLICNDTRNNDNLSTETFNSIFKINTSKPLSFQKCNYFLNLLQNIISVIKIINEINDELIKIQLKQFSPDLLQELNLKLVKLISDSYLPDKNPLITKKIVFMIKDNIDEYLDLARTIYHKNIEEIRKLTDFYVQKCNLELKNDSSHGICLKKIKKAADRKETLSPETFNIQNQPEIDGLKVIKETRLYILYSNVELKMLNVKLKQAFDQIVELSGKISAKFIFENNKIIDLFADIANEIAELDLQQSLVCFSRLFDKVSPFNCSNNILIENATVLSLSYANFVRNKFKNLNFKNLSNFNLIIGANNSGKSTFADNFFLYILLHQIGSNLPANNFSLKIFNQIFIIYSYSEFIMLKDEITEHSLIILDEISGNVDQQIQICKFLSERQATTLCITHNRMLINYCINLKNTKIFTMNEFKAEEKVYLIENAIELCKKYFPEEFIKKAMKYFEMALKYE
ncbi:hypothetical protein NUSPORA_00080 [Nucleospora cyclopteri]